MEIKNKLTVTNGEGGGITGKKGKGQVKERTQGQTQWGQGQDGRIECWRWVGRTGESNEGGNGDNCN